MIRVPLNDGWQFSREFTEDIHTAGWSGEDVRLPHTVTMLPYNCFDDKDYQLISGYKRSFFGENHWSTRRIFVTFGGAAHRATVFCNGRELYTHRCGYTGFTVELTDSVRLGEMNDLVVKLDSRESLDQPPFGYVIDYMTYGGLYREAYLEITAPCYLSDTFVAAAPGGIMKSTVTLSGPIPQGSTLLQTVTDKNGLEVSKSSVSVSNAETELSVTVPNAELWSCDNPVLYAVCLELFSDGKLLDSSSVRFGFRSAEFREKGFYLNGKLLKIHGLNRHQSFPYVGYAMPESIQKLDADILKYELGCNAVRTSHYPQSQHFIDRCDELGLLVFTEIPGWQHIGGEDWKNTAVSNTRDMVRQYRNHPSVILWGVRINESQDDDELYRRTNKAAHELDPSRATGGVRYLPKSSLLEDVYTYNDFSHKGNNPGLKKKKEITPAPDAPYLVTEYGGHMFPTKAFDDEEHRMHHALRHARVLDDMFAASGVAGCFGWCAFDYNTHRDFGAGDRICYHGVMDMFRNPKPASFVYASQSEDRPVFSVSSSMDIGDHPAGYVGTMYAFTNADSIKLYKNDVYLREFRPDRSKYPGLPHPPLAIDDLIGGLLEEKEGFPHEMAESLKKCLQAVTKYGQTNLPLKYRLTMARLMLLHHLTIKDGARLYGEYQENWGGKAIVWRFDAVKNGQVISTLYRSPASKVTLNVRVSSTTLQERGTYDASLVRISAVDQNGTLLPYFQEPVTLKTSGCIALIGPEIITLKGGAFGTYVTSVGTEGEGTLTISNPQAGEITVRFQCEIEGVKK